MNYVESTVLGVLYPFAWRSEGHSKIRQMLRYRYAKAEFEGMNPVVRRHIRKIAPHGEYISVLEHPKCGRTYLRFMICHVLSTAYNIPFKYALFDPVIPECKLPRFRYIHGFNPLGHHTDGYVLVGETGLLQSIGIVLLYRDPLRVMISYYHQCRHRLSRFEGPFKEFIRNESLGMYRYASFVAHYKEEVAKKGGIILTYEELVAEPKENLKRVLEYAHIPFDDQAVAAAVAQSHFDKMKDLVSSKSSSLPTWLLPTSSNPNSQKVRDGGKTPLSAYYDLSDIQYVESVWKSFGHDDYGESFRAAMGQIDTQFKG